jgi:hypothetical protein
LHNFHFKHFFIGTLEYWENLVYNEDPVFSVIAEKSLDASHFASSSVSFSASSAPPLPPLAACCAVPLSSSSSSYLSPAYPPLLTCSRPPLPFLPSFFCFFEQNHPLPWPPPPLFAVGSHHQPLPTFLDPLSSFSTPYQCSPTPPWRKPLTRPSH